MQQYGGLPGACGVNAPAQGIHWEVDQSGDAGWHAPGGLKVQLYSVVLKEFEISKSFPENSLFLKRWENTYKNKYVSPAGYHSWEIFSKICFWLSSPKELLKARTDPKYTKKFQTVMGACGVAIDVNAPAMFLPVELFRCLYKTKVPILNTVPEFPFPVFCVLFSKQVLVKKVTFPGAIKRDLRVLGLIMVKPPKGVNDYLDGSVTALCLEEHTGEFMYLGDCIDWSAAEDENSLVALAKHIILLYNNKRELFTEEKAVPARGTGFGKGSKESDPEPTRFIGKFFENKVRYVGRSRGDKGGAKKRPHWRRGHWHKVCHGEGRKERKYQWFQPVYVCPSEDSSSEACEAS